MDQQALNEPPAGKPSQAEGEQPGDAPSQQQDPTETPAGHPSQAEGDRDEIEADLEQQG